ncbi:CopY/TcrY family copper transport repressor [Aerococcus viridans]|uniref:CopY/TcrY family copper transport repressor n=1 Tax=Aerococcus viridans TaxID=1377 RepID=UPI003B227050
MTSNIIQEKRQDFQDVSAAEWEVMRVVWAQKETNSRTIIASLEDKKDWKAATIKTLIGRLTKKGWLETTKNGKSFIYRPAIDEDTALENQAQTLLNGWCNTDADKVISALIQASVLDDRMKHNILNALDQATYVGHVTCNCAPGQCIHHPETH